MSNGAAADRSAKAIEEEIASEKLTFSGVARWYIGLATAAAILLAIKQLFNLRIGGATMLEGMYLYLLAGIFLSVTFLSFRVTGRRSADIPWYDWLLALATLVIGGYFAITSDESLQNGWEYAAPTTAQWMSIAFYLLILEGTRRAGGLILFGVVLLFSLYRLLQAASPTR